MFKNLLVHLPSERPLRPVVDCAVSLTASLGAHLDAIAVGYETIGTGLVVESAGAVAAVMAIEQQRAMEKADAAIAVFEIEARLAGISYNTRALAAVPAEAAETMGALARLHDLAIVLQPETARPSFDRYVAEAVLFNSGGPMLMVPYIHKGSFVPLNAAIAWDGSRLAARAVRDAMPFLTTAKTVTVIAVNEDRGAAGEASSARLALHLSRCGIHARVDQLKADRSNIHNAILSAVADGSIGLLVMGGYGHSRLHERILGGVTRGIFETMTVPTLMSH